ncbi:MAG: nucleoside 2-deoxyribosyltransferase [Chloroflexi bacterium]|nr:nucleoside 2-deoxyribosyltransferase [Chloroflexota bacterium]
MNIYFSCSLTGGRADEGVYAAIVDYLLAQGHEVPTAHLARPDVMALEQIVSPLEVYERDVQWVNECDALIAEVSTPSHGVGYEIALALTLGKPVLCCYRQGVRVTKMILGNTHPTLTVAAYADEAGALEAVKRFLNKTPR